MIVVEETTMAKPLAITLTEQERTELKKVREQHPRPYMRERASAILKIAEGQSGRQVASTGLLKRRHKTTIYEWVHRYQAEGIEGLHIKPGRGRKPSFFPSIPNGQ
jgi:hypothetical protein